MIEASFGQRMRRQRRLMEMRGLALRDAVLRPKARGKDDVPWSAKGITAEWIGATMGGEFPGERPVGVHVQGGSDGSSVRRRLSIDLADEAGQRRAATVFLKTCPNYHTRLGNAFTMASESNFYRLIRPQLAIEAPRGLHSAYDKRSYRCVHVLEDLVATKGAEFCTWRTAIDRANAEGMVDLLAELHGQFLGSDQIQGHRWIRPFSHWIRDAHIASGFDREHRKAFEVGRDLIPASLHDAGQESWGAMVASLAMHDQAPQTLIHSDVHLGNWYKTGAGAMGLCDWQCIARGHWGRDLSYALSTALDVEDRRRWERDLLVRYAERLSAKSGTAFGYDTVFDAYRRQLPAALAFWTTTLVPPPIMPDMQPIAMSRLMVTRIAAAMADVDSLAAFR